MDSAYGGLGASGGGAFYGMAPDQRQALLSPPGGALNGPAGYSAMSRQMRAPGLGAQSDMLEMYRQMATGQGPPSAAQQQLTASGQAQQRFAMNTGAQTGNVAGAVNASIGAGAQNDQQQRLLAAAQMQQGLAGYAGLGTQMQQQGLGYDQLNAQQLMGMQGMQTDWYLGGRQADMANQQANQQFNMGMLKAGTGLLGGLTGAVSGMGGKG